jgi:hypothetical protein
MVFWSSGRGFRRRLSCASQAILLRSFFANVRSTSKPWRSPAAATGDVGLFDFFGWM